MKVGFGAVQGVVFTNSLDLSRSLSVAQEFNSLKTIKFEGNPTILPLPADAPLEIPRIILRTNDNQFSINISPVRVDFFHNNRNLDKEGTPTGSLSGIEGKFTSAMAEISELIVNKFSARIPRLALVSNMVLRLEKSSKNYFLDNFIKNEGLKNSEEMQLNFLMKKQVSKYKYNEWLRFNTLRNTKNLEDDRAILFIIDLNTLAEVDYSFNKQSTTEFIKSCFSLTKTSVEQYTTGEGRNG